MKCVPTDPLFARGAAANTPPRNRNTSIDAVFLDSAAPTWKHVYTKKLPMNTGFRPTDSDNGPHRSGPTQ